MTRCKGICVNGYRCKKSVSGDFCAIHDVSIICEICKENQPLHQRTSLDCGHKFCKSCICNSIMESQWYDGFSTEDTLCCPECKEKVNDSIWKNLTSALVDRNFLTRKIVYTSYLSPDIYVKLYPVIKLNFEYNNLRELNKVYFGYNYYGSEFPNNKVIDSVFFLKYHGQQNCVYKFLLGNKNELIFQELEKELIETVFHPSRFKCIEDLDEF